MQLDSITEASHHKSWGVEASVGASVRFCESVVIYVVECVIICGVCVCDYMRSVCG